MNKMSPNVPPKQPAICVFCGSSPGIDPDFAAAARRLGELIAKNGYQLIFGGGGVGLMGEVAAATSEHQGKILGIIPDFLRHLEPPLHVKSEIVITATMNDRKAQMFAASDAFIVLPGGLGTLDELFEAHTNAQLGLHKMPIILVNTKNYWDPLLALIDHMIANEFARPVTRDLLTVVNTPEEAIAYVAEHVKV